MNYYVYPGLPPGTPKLHPRRVIDIVVALTGIRLAEIQGKTRKREVVFARALLAYLLTTTLQYGTSAVADVIYGQRQTRRGTSMDNRSAAKNLLEVHEALSDQNPIYNSITKQALEIYGTTKPRPEETLS